MAKMILPNRPYEYDGAYHFFGDGHWGHRGRVLGSSKSGHWGHKGIPGHRGGSAPRSGGVVGSSIPMSVQSALSKCARSSVEHLIVLDSSEKVIKEIDGDESTIMGSLSNEAVTTIHNHLDDSSFSPADVGTLLTSSVQDQYVVDSSGTVYQLSKTSSTPTAKGLYPGKISPNLYVESDIRDILGSAYKEVISGGSPTEEKLTNTFIRQASDKFNLNYTIHNSAQLSEPLFFGGPGSGHWGHAGRKGSVGGSVARSTAMSIRTGKDWEKRQARTKDLWGAAIKFYTPQGTMPGWDVATTKEQELFLQALDKLPDEVKQMWRGDNSDITLMVGEDKYSAKHMGNFIFIPRDSLDPDLGGVPRHEFAHHVAYQEYMRTQYGSYNPPELFNHAKIYNGELRINEHLTMMLDSFDSDPKVWARNLLKPVPIEAGLTESLADSQVSAAASFLKGIGAL